jgi:hypothetical protein
MQQLHLSSKVFLLQFLDGYFAFLERAAAEEDEVLCVTEELGCELEADASVRCVKSVFRFSCTEEKKKDGVRGRRGGCTAGDEDNGVVVGCHGVPSYGNAVVALGSSLVIIYTVQRDALFLYQPSFFPQTSCAQQRPIPVLGTYIWPISTHQSARFFLHYVLYPVARRRISCPVALCSASCCRFRGFVWR